MSIASIIFTIAQSIDRSTDGNLCSESIINSYRPFKVHFDITMGNITNYKMCSIFPSNNQTRCYKVDILKDPTKTLFCAWTSLRQFQHLFTHFLLLPVSLVGVLWIFKDQGLWIISGFAYTFLVFIGFLVTFWILVMDSWDIHNSQIWCNSFFKEKLCDPRTLIPEIQQNCQCDYISLVSNGPLFHSVIMLTWLALFVICCIRWYGYRYHSISGEDEKEKEQLTGEKKR